MACRRRELRDVNLTRISLIVGNEPLQVPDGDRNPGRLFQITNFLTLRFLRAHSPADGREDIGLFDLTHTLFIIPYFNELYKGRDIDSNRATHHALRIGTIQAPLRFLFGHFFS